MTIPKQIVTLGNIIAHAILGAGIVVGLVTGKIDPTVGYSVLAGLGSFWSGVGATLRVSGASTAATVAGGGSVPSVAAPTPDQKESGDGPNPFTLTAPK